MSKFALFPFRGEPLCFIHVLLNVLDMNERGHEAIIVLEGESVTLVAKMAQEGHMLHPLYVKAKDKGHIAGACKACSAKLKATDAVLAEGLPLLEGMSGHPSMAEYVEKGYAIVTF
ncbi:DsrE family protein [Oceanidesulfovibrio marinus]|uniref:Cytoplasmic protein n=1 Tax=Oceanidesulfovibrio marinus TaxID=370038 RepID=A0A6P1Z9Y0_9BACT|nr:DsrE family protein [Oceanidesulfovibrio marinus]TVM30224.1 cytoplasmic protein [Oceanidesulfovibrio marinus]